MQDYTKLPTGGISAFVRLYWMFLGNVLLLFLLAFIFEKHPKLPSRLDAACLIVVASLILARYVDIRFLNGETGEGNAATMTHWRRYALLVGPVGVGAWLLVRVLAIVLR